MRVSPVVAAMILPAIVVPQALSAQTEQRSLRGAQVSIYNLAGQLRAKLEHEQFVTIIPQNIEHGQHYD